MTGQTTFWGAIGLTVAIGIATAVDRTEETVAVSYRSVETPLLTPRIRVMNSGETAAHIWAGRPGADSIRLGSVDASSTRSFVLPYRDGLVRVWGLGDSPDRLFDRTTPVSRSTDLALVIAHP